MKLCAKNGLWDSILVFFDPCSWSLWWSVHEERAAWVVRSYQCVRAKRIGGGLGAYGLRRVDLT